MKKLPLNKNLKAEHKSDNSVLMEKPESGTIKEVRKNESIKKQFAQGTRIYERIKCPIAAIACSFIHQI